VACSWIYAAEFAREIAPAQHPLLMNDNEPDPAAAAIVDDYAHISNALGHPVPAKILRTDDGRCVTCRLAFKDPDPRVAVLLNIISFEEAAAVIEAGMTSTA
jgi:hypothetical protein